MPGISFWGEHEVSRNVGDCAAGCNLWSAAIQGHRYFRNGFSMGMIRPVLAPQQDILATVEAPFLDFADIDDFLPQIAAGSAP